MVVVGEMHVGKGREEKGKRKGREREVKGSIPRTRPRLSHARCACEAVPIAREMHAACPSSRAR